MRSCLICVSVAIALLTAFPAAAQPEGTNALPQAVEQCIRDNAPAVERAIDRLPDAVDFLVVDLCAKPIAEEQLQVQKSIQQKMLAGIKERCARSSRSKTDDVSCAIVDQSSDAAMGWTIYGPAQNKPADATSLAARLLLELRIQHPNATSTQGTH